MQRRRRYLQTLLAGTVTLLAGCSDGGTDTTTEPAGTATGTRTPDQSSPSETVTPTATFTTAGVATDITSSTTAATPMDTTTTAPKLAADDGDSGDFFGAAVALDGDTALVGANFDEDPNGSQSGSAYVFTRTNGSWSQATKLTADDGDSDDRFGSAVALAGDTALIGAPSDEDPNGSGDRRLTGAGAAYIFDRTDGTWSQTTKLAADDGDASDAFGSEVALTDGTAIIAAPSDEDPNGAGAGSVYVFDDTDGTWSQNTKLTADDGDSGDSFGGSVALQETTLVVGANDDEDPNGRGAGAAYVFEKASGSWSQQAKLAADDGDDGDGFGRSVDVDGDTIIVGANTDEDPNGTDSGAAYLFSQSGGAWTQDTKLSADDGSSFDQFGYRVAVDGSTALIGAYARPSGLGQGAVYVFENSGGTWSQTQTLEAADGDNGDFLGSAIAFEGTTAVVGARTDADPNGSNAGAAYVFEV